MPLTLMTCASFSPVPSQAWAAHHAFSFSWTLLGAQAYQSFFRCWPLDHHLHCLKRLVLAAEFLQTGHVLAICQWTLEPVDPLTKYKGGEALCLMGKTLLCYTRCTVPRAPMTPSYAFVTLLQTIDFIALKILTGLTGPVLSGNVSSFLFWHAK